MQENTASRTAQATAYLRAVHQILDQPPLLLSDPVAVPLLGSASGQKILAQRDRFQRSEMRSLRAHVCLRSRFAEDRLAAAAADGYDVYILLGAGYDSFAWRQPNWAKKLRIVEIDHPDTQADKRARLVNAGLDIPENLTFVTADFSREPISQVFDRAGIVRGQRVFFSWLGVCMYLSMAAIDDCLRAIAVFDARLVMTFRQPAARGYGIACNDKLSDRVADVGEPFVTFFSQTEMEAKLRSHGFGHVAFLTPGLSKKLYFTPPCTDLLFPHRTNIAYAAKRRETEA